MPTLGCLMDQPQLILKNPPIVEAMVDFECDVLKPPDLRALVPEARKRFGGQYPTLRELFFQEHQVAQQGADPATLTTRRGVEALQFLGDDEKQVVQVRAQGFSFNRLAPYTTLDDYLAEIARTWKLYCELVDPVEVRIVRLRTINRLLLPLDDGSKPISHYLEVGAPVHHSTDLAFTGFLHQDIAVDPSTGNDVHRVTATQAARSDGRPIILDITATSTARIGPGDWSAIESKIQSLRTLKNRVFRNTLKPPCLQLFQ